MSSVFDVAERARVAVDKGLASDPSGLRDVVGRWLMFGDYGAAARRHMAIVWSCAVGCILVIAVWLPNSRLSFAPSNWASLLQGIGGCVLAGAFFAIAFNRVRGDGRRPAVVLHSALAATELLWRIALPMGALLTAGVSLSYLVTAADLPLQDALLARIDRDLGFDWPRFLDLTNSSPVLATSLVWVYGTIDQVAKLVIVWLALNRRGARVAELLAVLSLSTVALCIGSCLVPAAGAFAYYDPAPQLFGNFAASAEMWPFARTFAMLRDGSLAVIDFSALQGVVSFPSFHTMLGVMTVYALRETRWLMIPVLLLNGTMIVSTLPVGGHHLADVLVGAGLTGAAIVLVRCMARNQAVG